MVDDEQGGHSHRITEPERAIFRKIKKALGKLLDATAPTRAETLKKADITPNAYNIAMRRGSLRLIWIIRLLDFCGGGDLARFFAGALAAAEPEPPELKIARRRMADTEQAEPSADVRRQLEKLATLAREKPVTAVVLARELVEVVQLEELPRVLALCGTAYRLQEFHGVARANLRQALKWEQDPALKADVHQRLAYVYGALEEWEQAHCHAAQAMAEYVLLGLDSKVGETFVDRGMFFYHQGDLTKAIASHSRAVSLLDSEATENVFTAYHGLALCGHEVEANLARAEEIPVGNHPRAKLSWFKAQQQEQHGNYAEAFHDVLSVALFFLEAQRDLDACWAASEAARLSLLIPADTDTKQLAKVVGKLTFALPDDSGPGIALMRLWVGLTSREATREDIATLVGVVHEAIERERLKAARALPA